MTVNPAATAIILLPLMNKNNKPVANAHRLIFFSGLVVYYSYQYPIAFRADKQLTIRADFWTSRRAKRKQHTDAILLDYKLAKIVRDGTVGILLTNVPERLTSNDFLDRLNVALNLTPATVPDSTLTAPCPVAAGLSPASA